MTPEQWAALVRRLEPQARQDPKAYGRKVALLVVLLAFAGPALLLKLLLPIGALGLLILRSLSVRMDPPGGIEVRRSDAPELFRMIDEVNETVKGPKVHKVLIDP